MKDQTTPLQIPHGKRLLNTYRQKKANDQSFFATMVGLQVFGFAIILFSLVFYLIHKSQIGLPPL